MSPAAWAPMVAPPLPLANDALWNTCEHAGPDEDCEAGMHAGWAVHA